MHGVIAELFRVTKEMCVRIPTHPATHSSVNRPPYGKAVACWTGATLLVGF